MKAVINAKIISPKAVLSGQSMVFDRRILEISAEADLSSCDIIDAQELYLFPGFVDIHIHGYGGADAMDATPEALAQMASALAAQGVTSFLPTTVSAGYARLEAALNNMRDAAPAGARVLGAHLEGPYISPARPGAHDPSALKAPDIGFVRQYCDVIRTLTVAPELPGALEFIEKASGMGIAVSIGHSACDMQTALDAARRGAGRVTHIFNAMEPLHHRRPGLAGAALCSDALAAELICDGAHVDGSLFRLVHRAKGDGGVVLVSDCLRAGGLPAGSYAFGDGRSASSDGTALRLADGTLCGSAASLSAGARNYYRLSGATLCQAVNAASLWPAQAVNMHGDIGSVECGKYADFFLAGDDFVPQAVFIGGQIVRP